MFRDFILFVAALWHEWKTLLTGGSIIALVTVWSLSSGKPLPQTVNWLIVGLTMMLASFLSWRKQWMEADKDYVSLLPSELTSLAKEGAALHAETSVKPYIGKRIRVTGTINNMFYAGPWASIVWLDCDEKRVTLLLSRWGLKPFAPLPIGTPITVVGRIVEISLVEVTLRDIIIVASSLQGVEK